MRSIIILKILSPNSPSFLGLLPPPPEVQGDGEWSLHHPLFLPLLQEKSFPCSSVGDRRQYLSNMSPSHRQQLFPNCSYMSHLSRVQSFQHSLLQHRSAIRVTSSIRTPALVWALLAMGLQVQIFLPTGGGGGESEQAVVWPTCHLG